MRNSRTLTLRDLIGAALRRLPLWICVFALAGALVLAVHYFMQDPMTVSAVVYFSYDGIESGYDPSGNRFDEQEMKSEGIIREAASAAGRAVSSEDVDTIQQAVEIRSVIPESAFEDITEYHSIFGENEVETLETVRETAYFPSRFTVTFHYARAGFSAEQGSLFLQELLSAYERFFYQRYGYSRSLENSISSIDYEDYDYINAVDVLNDRLASLRAYLSALGGRDNTRFVSSRTGFSFSDLIDSVDTIRNEDINWVTAYIVSNNITKDRQDLIDYYQFKIKDAERELAQRNSRLYTLTTQIEGYIKTNAVFLGIVDAGAAGEDGRSGNYEFSQQSQMYDALINEKVSCETAISETQERMALYQQRIERLQSDTSTGNPAMVEMNLKRIDEKVEKFLADTNETSDEYFRTVLLKRAFQVIEEPEDTRFAVTKLLRQALPTAEIVEAALLGLYILGTPGAALALKRKREAAAGPVPPTQKDAAASEAAPGETGREAGAR